MLHFTRSVAICQRLSGICANDISHDGQHVEPLVADHADVQLAAVDELLDDGRGAELLVNEGARACASCSSFSTTDACEMPVDASKNSDLTISGNVQPLGQRRLAAGPNDRELGHRNAVIREQLLRERLVAREDEAARIAAGVGQAQQLEIADDVLIEGRDAGKRLHQVEDDVRLEEPGGRRGCRRGRR